MPQGHLEFILLRQFAVLLRLRWCFSVNNSAIRFSVLRRMKRELAQADWKFSLRFHRQNEKQTTSEGKVDFNLKWFIYSRFSFCSELRRWNKSSLTKAGWATGNPMINLVPSWCFTNEILIYWSNYFINFTIENNFVTPYSCQNQSFLCRNEQNLFKKVWKFKIIHFNPTNFCWAKKKTSKLGRNRWLWAFSWSRSDFWNENEHPS